jgi:ADP-ribose pyrophosphatase YjhB (NUDIX family)
LPDATDAARMDLITLLDEIRALARTGLHYAENPFDRARCTRLLELAAQGYADVLTIEPDEIRRRFVAETGYATTKLGADGAVFDADDRVLLVRRADDGTWGLVAGWVDPNESPVQTLVREFAEELGVEGRVERLAGAFFRAANAEYGPHSVISLVYLCSVRDRAFTLQQHEVLEAAWHDIDAITDWHLNHEALARGAREAWWRFQGGL